jgi:hypothetical protein
MTTVKNVFSSYKGMHPTLNTLFCSLYFSMEKTFFPLKNFGIPQ